MSGQEQKQHADVVEAARKRRREEEELFEGIAQDICELGDYTSPPDQPDLLQCRMGELDVILRRRLEPLFAAYHERESALAESGRLREALTECLVILETIRPENDWSKLRAIVEDRP